MSHIVRVNLWLYDKTCFLSKESSIFIISERFVLKFVIFLCFRSITSIVNLFITDKMYSSADYFLPLMVKFICFLQYLPLFFSLDPNRFGRIILGIELRIYSIFNNSSQIFIKSFLYIFMIKICFLMISTLFQI